MDKMDSGQFSMSNFLDSSSVKKSQFPCNTLSILKTQVRGCLLLANFIDGIYRFATVKHDKEIRFI